MDRVKKLSFPVISSRQGNLSFIEENNQIPFEIKRCYWIYDVPGGQIRGGHAFKKQHEVIIALSGSLDVVADNGITKMTYKLNRSYDGLYLTPGLWRYMENFATNTIVLVISSTTFSEDDYIRDYSEFLKFAQK